jgi:hypothetical protein
MRPSSIRLFSLAGALLLGLANGPVHAQSRVEAEAQVRAAPGGNVVATLNRNTTWATGTSRGGWTLLTIQGWMESSRFAGPRDSFPEHIGGTNTLRVREEPSLNGRILGEFEAGAGLHVIERRGNWARIRRDVWIASSVVTQRASGATTTPTTRTPAQAARTPAADPPAGTTAPPSPDRPPAAATTPGTPPAEAIVPPRGDGALRAASHASLRSAPDGILLGELAPGAIVETRGRDRGWVKVRIEAWVADSLFVPADTSFGATLSAADLRLDPAGTRGRVVRWEVQVVGLQTADPLRRDLNEDEPFLLAMGPTGEDAILYIAVPPNLLAEARGIPAMSKVLVTARVRVGRSAPTGAPVLDLLSFVRR